MIDKLEKFIKVEQLGNNQFVVEFSNGYLFQSYESIVAYKIDGEVYLTDKWDYSRTTLKYLYRFLEQYCYFNDLNKKKVEKLIKDGEIKLLN